jgi:chromosome segregation protein
VKTIFNEAGREGTKLEGILGVVADKFEVPEKYARALEVALGHSLQLLMVRSAQDALAAFPIIEDRGEASFLPLDGLDEPESLEQPQGVGLLGSALDFVTCERTFSPAARQLLANTYFVRDLSSALRIFEISRPGVRLATLSGELLVSRGTMRKIGREASPLLSREREISRLERRYKELKAEKDEMQRAVDEARERYNITDRRFSDEQELAQRLEIELAGARGEEARTEHHCQNLKAESDSVGKEISEIENQQGESALEERDLQRRISEGQEREEAVDNSLRELQEALALKTDEREQIQAFITELKVKLATAREEEKSARLRFERASSEVKKVQDAVEARNVQIQRSASRRRALAAEIEGLRVAIDSLLSEKDTTDTNIKDREESKSTLYEKLKNAESRLKEQISRVGELKDETSKHEIVLVKRRAERDVIAGRIRDQYEVDLTGVALDEGIEDWNSVKEKIEKLKNRLKRIGPVNMVALEEHKELENRFSFLTDQEKDLLSARDSLKKAIDRINTETTRMFTETFEAVKTHFREMFTELFGGGSANLVLEEGVDILEAGINIVARPPGKKLQNISLLSGGERALTAVSLLFAILKVKPSPFCVLDEIDAPLDESNINRFLALLQKFLENSQFIIVTHNKRTISMADIMYGITMEESGVSKVVSAKLTKEHEKKSGSRERSTAGSKATR